MSGPPPAGPVRHRILLATDAWSPQVNGVVRCLEAVAAELAAAGHAVEVVHPGCFRTVAAPRYPEIRLAIAPGRGFARRAEAFGPDRIPIATEGPIGMAARRWCRRRRRPFTSSYHTHFPLYLRRYFGLPTAISWRLVRWFHGPAKVVLASSPSAREDLRRHGLPQAMAWTRGIDRQVFRPHPPPLPLAELPRPVLLYVGRVSPEKNLEAFLSADLPGSKVVVGDGPSRAALAARHPRAIFLGWRFGEALARHYAAADVLVFPSRTDTFGVVMIEANACGTPVAAFPVGGPRDVIRPGENGWMHEDLRVAVERARSIPRERCLADSQRWRWDAAASALLEAMAD
jgi:glycosyltransferase involved in cell wall biosynthesis